jgi:hypothetical protein
MERYIPVHIKLFPGLTAFTTLAFLLPLINTLFQIRINALNYLELFSLRYYSWQKFPTLKYLVDQVEVPIWAYVKLCTYNGSVVERIVLGNI